MTMDLTPDPREAKLPKWAVDQLQRYRTEVRGLEAALAEAKGGITDSGVHVVDYIRGNTPLPEDARVAWGLPLEEEPLARRRIQCYREDGWLWVQGSHGLHIQPQASNLTKIRLEDSR
ncbi:hypothetical protein ACFW6C_07390 [Streptomyces fungicidicus]|uniref:DUF7239 family protein n=1 Tax=Streptomyces fungicidicus TaxID=68203 RepID=UPI0036D0E0EB